MIVVGVDGSAGSGAALRWADAAARLHGVPLVAVHVGSPISELVVHTEEVRRRDEELTRWTEDAVATAGVGDHEVRVVHGDVAKALVAASGGAELLAVGRHGDPGLAGAILGSVSRQVVERATVPTAVVPEGAPAAGGGRVVVGVDGSEPALAAVRWAVAEAQARGAALLVVHGYQPAGSVALTDRMSAPMLPDLHAAAEAIVAAGAEHARALTTGAVETSVVAAGAAEALLGATGPADLLVVGTRGMGHVAGMLLGSTAWHCVRRSVAPVVVVPAPAA